MTTDQNRGFLGPLIAGAFPRNTAKIIEIQLGCTARQARRIAVTGKVPGRFRAMMLRLIDQAIASNKAELDRLHEQLRGLEYEAMVARSADRRAQAADADFTSAP